MRIGMYAVQVVLSPTQKSGARFSLARLALEGLRCWRVVMV